MHSLFRVIPKTTFTSSTTAIDIVLAKYIQSAAFVSGAVVVRVHSFPTGGTWNVLVQNTSYSEDEPNTVFSTTTNQTTVAVTGSSVNLYVQPLNTPLADRVRVVLQTPASGAQSITLSVDLIGRDA